MFFSDFNGTMSPMDEREQKSQYHLSSKTLTAAIISVVILISIAAVIGYIIGTTVGANNASSTQSDQDINSTLNQ